MEILRIQVPFELEQGAILPELEIGYHTFGSLNEKGDNVIWVCHALTANSDVSDWWAGLYGSGSLFDPDKYFIVCANILGSPYGSSGPLSINPKTGTPYYSSFPQITIRDMVKAHQLLADKLKINKIYLGIGGSMGGYQVLEWAYSNPELFENITMLVSGSAESAWGKAIHTSQRMAIEADPTWTDMTENAGNKGLEAARGIGMLTYRNYEQFVDRQSDESPNISNHRAESYIRYQGQKLSKRFNAFSYHLLTNAMDSHHIARGRGTLPDVLAEIKTRALVIGIKTDFLCPVAEQKKLASGLANASYIQIDSPFGHDGFLIEADQIRKVITEFLTIA